MYFVSSADWMTRNLYRRIECGAPILEPKIKEFLGNVLELSLSDNVKATYIDELLNNIPKRDGQKLIRTQKEMYNVVEQFNQLPPFIIEYSDRAEGAERVIVPRMGREPRTKQSWLGRMVFRKKSR